MSKKYKLKKWYPSLPKEMPVGFEVIKNNLCNYLNPQTRFYPLASDEVENNTEFWEEIKEPEFQILEATTSVKVSLTTENISTKIYKILRLSDNETFSVGDKIEHHYKDNPEIVKIYTIEKIYTLEDGSLRFYVGNGLNLDLERLKKYSPKVVFTTEDGVEINSDRKLFGVSLNDNIGYKAYDLAEHDYRYGSSINLIGFKWFIDKGKAIAYTNLNRPRYSMKNLLDAKVLSSDAAGYPALFIDLNKLK